MMLPQNAESWASYGTRGALVDELPESPLNLLLVELLPGSEGLRSVPGVQQETALFPAAVFACTLFLK
jgi:hypothetical protein